MFSVCVCVFSVCVYIYVLMDATLITSIFCLPADKATAKSVKNNSPTDSEMQTAVASKDKGIF